VVLVLACFSAFDGLALSMVEYVKCKEEVKDNKGYRNGRADRYNARIIALDNKDNNKAKAKDKADNKIEGRVKG
jgi:hypothetical protein